MFTNSLNVGLSLWAWVKKIVDGVETPFFSSKEKIPGAAVSKDGDTGFWDVKGPITIDFLDKGVSYCQLVW